MTCGKEQKHNREGKQMAHKFIKLEERLKKEVGIRNREDVTYLAA